MSGINFITKVNRLASNNREFFFMVDFDKKKPIVLEKEELRDHNIFFKIGDKTNYKKDKTYHKENIKLKVIPVDKEVYKNSFKSVINHIKKGDSFLLNLTFPSEINLNTDLKTIFSLSKSKFKLLYKDEFVCFSPESFINIVGDHIYSYPMKGTISSKVKDAKKKILESEKETREHNTIVDLIRNDMSMNAKNVIVKRFRYLETVKNKKESLYQVVSEIEGKLNREWKNSLGDLLWSILPAGSVSGAPKEKTLEIIHNNEIDSRGYYCGVFGYFDGANLQSSVAIRFIEKNKNKFFYRSGGGITSMSDLDSEYNELKKKIYVPIV